jgi:hypothetical protein
LKQFLETHFVSVMGPETAAPSSEVEQLMAYFRDRSSGFTLRSGVELGDEYEAAATLAVKLAQDLGDLMRDHFESVRIFLASLAKEHPEEVLAIVEGQAAPMSAELVREIGDFVAKPVDAMTTEREQAGEDPTEQYRMQNSYSQHRTCILIRPCWDVE